LSLIEDIRCAEKDVMEVQERLLRVGNKDDWIELKPWNVENYSLLCPRMFAFNTNEQKGGMYLHFFFNTFLLSKNVNFKLDASNDNIVKKSVYGIHSEMRRLRLGLNKERRMLVY